MNGNTDLSDSIKKENNLSCERAHLYKNYYAYFYGLPMKLKDPGTKLSEEVILKTFKGKEYLVLRVDYDEVIGKDTGEYILLTETATMHGIKMPKNRAWYYNKDNTYLGTDILN